MADTEATLAPDPIEDDDEGTIDSLAGEELFEISDADLDDEPAEGGAPAPDATPTPAKGPPDSQSDATQPRDTETGKFLPKGEAPAKDGSAPAAEGQPPAPAEGDQSAPAAEGAQEPEPELEFSFRADGQQIQIKGSRVTQDGIFIPREHQAQFQRLLSHGVTYSGSFRQRLEEADRRVADMEAAVNEDVEKSKAYLEFFAGLLDRTEKGELDELNRTPVEAWLEDFSKNRLKLEAQAELAAAKAFREARAPRAVRVEGFDDDQPAGPQVSQEDLEALSEQLAPEVGNRIMGIMRSENIAGLTGGEITRIRDWMVQPANLDRFFRRAQDDIPKEESGLSFDIQKGQIVAMDAEIRDAFKYQAQLILDARKQALELSRAREANNGKRPAPNQIPPTTTVKGAGVPKGQQAPPVFKTQAEMEAWFNSDEGDPVIE